MGRLIRATSHRATYLEVLTATLSFSSHPQNGGKARLGSRPCATPVVSDTPVHKRARRRRPRRKPMPSQLPLAPDLVRRVMRATRRLLTSLAHSCRRDPRVRRFKEAQVLLTWPSQTTRTAPPLHLCPLFHNQPPRRRVSRAIPRPQATPGTATIPTATRTTERTGQTPPAATSHPGSTTSKT